MNSRMSVLALLVVACLSAATGGQPSGPTPAQLADRIQERYDRVRDFSADFTHEAESGVLRKKLVEQGTLLVKKPGRMRWMYKAPDVKTFVSDGVRMYMHTPADNQVIVSPVPTDDQATTAVLFLTGKGKLTRDFTITFAEDAAPGTFALRLEPKLPERDYDWLQLVVGRETLQIQSLTALDKQGTRSTFRFKNLKENVGLADKAFVFTIPKGADVIQAGQPGR